MSRTVRDLLAEAGRLTEHTVAALVTENGGAPVLRDLHAPAPEGATAEPLEHTDPRALPVIRHSAAHVMADAVQRLFPGTQVTIGPAIDEGFYYDFYRAEGTFSEQDLARIEKEMRAIVKRDVPFAREEVTRAEAEALFADMDERFKLEILRAIPEGERISLYRHGKAGGNGGTWVDLCEGPHVPSTRYLGAVKLLSVAGAYWRGDEKNPMLQRIYGTAFPSEEGLAAHLKRLEEARQRDHRKLGKELELFLFHEWAPAMPFYLPRGAFVVNRLVDYVRGLYERHGYQEIITPQLFDRRLFERSGHLQNYRENMYFAVTDDALRAASSHGGGAPSGEGPLLGWLEDALAGAALKPMNCPSHCLVFGQRRRSYRELPLRLADFGRLHRYERGGVVHGLARVRSFCQDDAHIFCAPEQLQDEIKRFGRLLDEVYRCFGFTDVRVKLALRPEHRLGTPELWDEAEGVLERALVETGVPFEKLPGEGAFYGPKLEYHVTDALGRSWQLGTIQLDYALPERFELEYVAADGAGRRPVMLHRAILGSLERFFGVYLEHCAGRFPTWLAPEQVVIVTVSERQAEYAARVGAQLEARGLRVVVDAGADKLGAKIRAARLLRVPWIAVTGDAEAAAGTVAPRSREGDLEPMTVAAFAERVLAEAKPLGADETMTEQS